MRRRKTYQLKKGSNEAAQPANAVVLDTGALKAFHDELVRCRICSKMYNKRGLASHVKACAKRNNG